MRRLTKKEKLRNKRKYKIIRQYYEIAKTKMTEEQLGRIGYVQFRNRVLAQQRWNNLNVREASRKVLNTETFTSPAERSRTNFIEGIKEHFKEEYKYLAQLSRDERGRYKSLKDNMKWDKDQKGYVIGNRYYVDVTNSPEEVIIIDLMAGTVNG